jgi:hypothetical protein
MFNSVTTGKELDKLKRHLKTHIEEFCKSVNEKKYSLVTDNSIHDLGWTDALRLFVMGFESFDSPIKNLLTNSIYRLNQKCPLAIPLYFRILTGGDFEIPSRGHRVSSREAINSFMNVNDTFLKNNIETLVEALEIAGSAGTVQIEKSVDGEVSIEVNDGFTVSAGLNSFFSGYVSNINLEKYKIIVVDGAILSVGEIHHILQHSFETKDGFVIIASSFSDDVSNTLFVNWKGGKTRVLPFVISDQLNSINEIKDVCSIIGQLPISNDNGLNLSSIDIKEYKNDLISYSAMKDELKIDIGEKNKENADLLKSNIQKKIEKEKVQDIKDILTHRLSKIAGRKVVVKLCISDQELGLVQDKSASFFRFISRCGNQGVVKMSENYPVKFLPWMDAVRAIKMAKSDKDVLNNAKAVLRVDNE